MAVPESVFSNTRTGIDRRTGRVLSGWPHVAQSMTVIFTTRFWQRIMRLDFGSDVPSLLDKPGNALVIAKVYMAVYRALLAWEPGFRLTQMQLVKAGADGKFTLNLSGIYYPRGHLGDYTVSEPANTSLLLGV